MEYCKRVERSTDPSDLGSLVPSQWLGLRALGSLDPYQKQCFLESQNSKCYFLSVGLWYRAGIFTVVGIYIIVYKHAKISKCHHMSLGSVVLSALQLLYKNSLYQNVIEFCSATKHSMLLVQCRSNILPMPSCCYEHHASDDNAVAVVYIKIPESYCNLLFR